MTSIRSGVSAVFGAILFTGAAMVQAGDYCCTCKGEAAGKTIDAGARALAIAQCSAECGGFTNVTSGKCAAPPPTAAAATPTPAAATTDVRAYKSDDCSGDPVRIAVSTAKLEQGIRSFQVESGAPASGWEKPDYAGRHTEPVGPSICISPGFDIFSVQVK